MSEARDENVYELVCPHCRKRFRAPLLQGAAARYRGFKCRHCKLFVPYDRAAEQLAERAS